MDIRISDLAARLRHSLHRAPELSMRETETCRTLMEFLQARTRLEIQCHGTWFTARRPAREDPRPPIAFRADMDALPIAEAPALVPWASAVPGVSHKCGHDGHSAALAAFAMALEESDVTREVFLVFQHAEETGQGGKPCSEFLVQHGVSEVYAFHNYPGLPLGTVAAPDGPCQPASAGMILNFTGAPSHAARPEDGRNPAFAIAEILSALPELCAPEGSESGLRLVTVICVQVGARAFGTSPGSGQLLLTLRAEREEEFQALKRQVSDLAGERAEKHGLALEISWEDVFPATWSHPREAEKVRQAARRLGLPVMDHMELFRASEDFGWYTQRIPGAMFYLGSGVNCPPLHTPGYDFPDTLLSTAGDLFLELCR